MHSTPDSPTTSRTSRCCPSRRDTGRSPGRGSGSESWTAATLGWKNRQHAMVHTSEKQPVRHSLYLRNTSPDEPDADNRPRGVIFAPRQAARPGQPAYFAVEHDSGQEGLLFGRIKASTHPLRCAFTPRPLSATGHL